MRMYHVQFFSDNSLTHWMTPSTIIPYEGYDKLKEYLVDLKAKVSGGWRGDLTLISFFSFFSFFLSFCLLFPI